MSKLDPRLNAYRPDLADYRLKNQVEAEQYVKGKSMMVCLPLADLKRAPGKESALDKQCLFGERMRIFEDREGWCWCQSERDGYVGYLETDQLMAVGDVNGVIKARSTFVFPKPDIKSPPMFKLYQNSLFHFVDHDDDFVEMKSGGYIYRKHLERLTENKSNEQQADFVEMAQSYLDVPYLWGGNSDLGIDCSGLVYMSIRAVGLHVVRDAYMQEESLGEIVKLEAKRQRGDLIFWPGHVGIMVDETHLLHANAFHLKTVIEPLSIACERILAMTSSGIRTCRRLP